MSKFTIAFPESMREAIRFVRADAVALFVPKEYLEADDSPHIWLPGMPMPIGGGSWGDKTASTQLTTLSDTLQYFTNTPQMNPGQTNHEEVECDFASTPTDNLEVQVQGTLDASSESWDETPITAFEIDNGTDPNKVSFLVSGFYKYRVGVQSTGATDDHTSADRNYRSDGVSV